MRTGRGCGHGMGFDERARTETGRGVEPGEPRSDDGNDCGERVGIAPPVGPPASEEVSSRWSGPDRHPPP